MVGVQRGHCVHMPLIHQDRVAFCMSVALIISADLGIENLGRFALRHRTGHYIGRGSLTVQIHLEIRLRVLLSVSHDFFFNDQCGSVIQVGFRLTDRGIHTLDLGRLHLHVAVRVHMDDRGRIQNPLSGSFSFSIMLLYISYFGVFANMKRMDTVMLRRIVSAAVDTASGHNRHIRVFSDVKIIIYKIFQSVLADDHRDMHALVFGSGLDDNVDARFIFFAYNINIGSRIASGKGSVGTDIVCAFRHAVEIRDLLQHVHLQLIYFLLHLLSLLLYNLVHQCAARL